MGDEEKTRLTVDIYGTQYRLRGSSSLGYMKRIAALVNDQMHSISSSNERLDTIKIAVLAAVNIADEHLKMRVQVESTTLELERLSTSEKEQRAKATQAEEQFELARKRQGEADERLQRLQTEMQELTRSHQEEAARFKLAEQQWTEERSKLTEEHNTAASELASLTVRADELLVEHQLLQESHVQLQVKAAEAEETLERERLAILNERNHFAENKKQLEAQLEERTQETVKFAERTKEHENVRNSLMQERKSLQEKANTAQAELVKLKQELERSKARVDELNAIDVRNRNAREASSVENAAVLKRLKEAHDAEIQKLRQTFATETENLKNERRAEIRKFQDIHSAELRKLQENHSTEIRQLQGIHAEDLLQLQDEDEAGVNKLNEAHKAELGEMRLRLQEAESYLLEETERLRATEEKQRQKLKAMYDDELERKDVFLAEELERQKVVLLAQVEALKQEHEMKLAQLRLSQESDAEVMFRDLETETARLVAAAVESAKQQYEEQSLDWDGKLSQLEERSSLAELEREEATQMLEMQKHTWDEEKDHLEYTLLVMRTEINQIADREKQLAADLENARTALVEQQEQVDPNLNEKYAALEHEYEMLKKEYNEWIELVMENNAE